MLPGWSAENVADGYMMISPWEAAERRRAENGFATRISNNVRPQVPGGGGGGCNTDRSPLGWSGGVDRGPILASQGGATIGREYRRVALVSTR